VSGPGTRKLARVLHRKTKATGKGPMGLDASLFGKVVSIQQGTNIDTLTLQVGGASGSLIAGVEHLDSYDPKVGAQVNYHVIHGVPFVIGAMGPFAPYPSFTPYVPPPPTPTVDVAFYVASCPESGAMTINAFTAAGALVTTASAGLYEVTGFFRPQARWAALSPGQGLLGVIGWTTVGTPYDQRFIIYELGAFGYPGLVPLATVDIAGTSAGQQCSCVWDPNTPLLYVFYTLEVDDVATPYIAAYAPDGTLVAGPLDVTAVVGDAPFPVISATADGYVYLVDNSGESLGVWAAGTLDLVGTATLPSGGDDAFVTYVAQGDGSVDVLGGAVILGTELGPLYSIAAGGPTVTKLSDSDGLGTPYMAGVVNSILFMLGSYVNSSQDHFEGWNVAVPELLEPFSLLVGPLTNILDICVAPDGVTCLALGKDGSDNLYVVPFYSGGSIGAPVQLTGSYDISLAAYATHQFMCSPYAHPAGPVSTE
jgi:hypothetical protein